MAEDGYPLVAVEEDGDVIVLLDKPKAFLVILSEGGV